MALLISQTLFYVLLVFPMTLSFVVSTTASAPNVQTVFCGAIYAKLALAFPFNALGTAFLLHTPDHAMVFLIAVVFLCHGLLALRRRPPFLRSCT